MFFINHQKDRMGQNPYIKRFDVVNEVGGQFPTINYIVSWYRKETAQSHAAWLNFISSNPSQLSCHLDIFGFLE